MTMTRALYDAAAIVMIVSGATKVADPKPFESTWLAIWRRPPVGMGRIVGVVEILLGGVAIVGPSMFPGSTALIASLVAAAYLAFTGVVLLAIRSGVSSCGCFGRRAAPPGIIHVITNLGAAGVAVVVAVGAAFDIAGAQSGVWAGLDDMGFVAVVQAALVVLLAWLVVVVDTDGASLAHEVSRARPRRTTR
jgi:hypothetical protein